MTEVFLSIGSNLECREGNIERALFLISQNPAIKNFKHTALIETKPIGILDQPDFINCAVVFDTSLGICDLFFFIQNIENNMGRKRTVKWGPRNIDIDIIFFGKCYINIKEPEIIVPHAEFKNREFLVKLISELED